MIFPKNITGPQFAEGDIVAFAFQGADLTFKIPVIPVNKHNEDSISSVRDFRNPDVSLWSEDDQGNHCEQLVFQRWSFEDSISLDNIASARLSISVINVNAKKLKEDSLLKFPVFEKVVIDGLAYSFPNEAIGGQSKSRFHAQQIEKNGIDWLQVMITFDLERSPTPTMFIPLTQSFFVMISLEIESLHYAGRTNPYTEEQLKQFERDLFDDFLSHIKIEYSPEIIATIQSLKNKTPA